MGNTKKASWLKRVENIIQVLEGSTISELELIEGETEIVIRRQPGIVVSAMAPGATTQQSTPAQAKKKAIDNSTPIITPITGVFYSSASPASPPFINVGDTISSKQVIALIESMKVFNEIEAESAGRVVAIVAKNGEVVQKGDVLIRIEPL